MNVNNKKVGNGSFPANGLRGGSFRQFPSVSASSVCASAVSVCLRLFRLSCIKVRLGRAMEKSVDFGELSGDENLKERITGFSKDLERSEKMLETFFSRFKYEDLSLEERVRYDLFLAFAINSLFWMYLRTKGTDPGQHEIKAQINRVREYINKSKSIYEKKTVMPRIDQGAAKRFVRSGLWSPENSMPAPEMKDKRLLKRKRDGDDK